MLLILARCWIFFALPRSVSVLADAMASRSASVVLIIPMTISNRCSSRRISASSRGGKVRPDHQRCVIVPAAVSNRGVEVGSHRCHGSRAVLNPVDVLDTLVNQPATLSMEPTVVLFGDTWDAHNTPNLRLTPQI